MNVVTVKQARTLAELTQEVMAEKMGIHVQTYRKIEKNPEVASIKQAEQISSITGLQFNQIFFGVNSTKSRKN